MPLHPALARNRVAVITGAASGIGLAAAKKFAGLGMKVVMADRSAERLQSMAAEVAAVSGSRRTSARSPSTSAMRRMSNG